LPTLAVLVTGGEVVIPDPVAAEVGDDGTVAAGAAGAVAEVPETGWTEWAGPLAGELPVATGETGAITSPTVPATVPMTDPAGAVTAAGELARAGEGNVSLVAA
jgi:hypothetical protein